MSAIDPLSIPGSGRLAGKVAVVTGAGTQGDGIGNGRAAALIFAREGARVAALDIDGGSAAETVAMLERFGGEGVACAVDVTDTEAAAAAVDSVATRWGRIDILQNNVGITGPIGTSLEVDLDAWDRVMQINVKSMVVMARHCIPVMVRSGGGAVVNVASVAGIGASQVPPGGGGVSVLFYRTSKAAVMNLTRAMAADHGPAGIRVNCVAPGYVHTPLVAGISAEKRNARKFAAPLQTEGSAWDVALASLYLVSDDARWVSGVVLPVDAGLTAAGLPPF
jgi:NAD(P)-dependent dehydrogenase (short-subunit alcohol dehydrogenase family)